MDLKYAVKGFGGAHNGRHLYNTIGGNDNKVDFFLMKAIKTEAEISIDMHVFFTCLAKTTTIMMCLSMFPKKRRRFLIKSWIASHGLCFLGQSTEGAVIYLLGLQRTGWIRVGISWQKHFALQCQSDRRGWSPKAGILNSSGTKWQIWQQVLP
jgi:hypothetical protein